MGKSSSAKSNFGSSKWIDHVLQGVAHWIGYKKQFYSGHLINEGAIVSEATGIMSAYMDSNQKIDCEKQYSEQGQNSGKLTTGRSQSENRRNNSDN